MAGSHCPKSLPLPEAKAIAIGGGLHHHNTLQRETKKHNRVCVYTPIFTPLIILTNINRYLNLDLISSFYQTVGVQHHWCKSQMSEIIDLDGSLDALKIEGNVNLVNIQKSIAFVRHYLSCSWILMSKGKEVGNTINCEEKGKRLVLGGSQPQSWVSAFRYVLPSLQA